MKKWLNIKPKVYDFSEDEIDTETESEDDGTVAKCLHWLVVSVFLVLFLLLILFSAKKNFPACSVKDARVHIREDHLHKAQENHSDCQSQISGCILYVYFGLARIKLFFFLDYYYYYYYFLLSKAIILSSLLLSDSCIFPPVFIPTESRYEILVPFFPFLVYKTFFCYLVPCYINYLSLFSLLCFSF